MKSVLWIEDQSSDLVEMLGPVDKAGYSVTIASDISRALQHLSLQGPPFTYLVVDVRMEAGDNREWSRYGLSLQFGSKPVRLGLDLLRSMFVPSEQLPRELPRVPRPSWVTQENTGVLTVDPFEDIARSLKDALGDDAKSRYVRKNETGDLTDRLLQVLLKIEDKRPSE